MEGLLVLLVMLAIGLIGAGPLAVIFVIVLFKKIGGLENRLLRIESKSGQAPLPAPQPKPFEQPRGEPVWSGRGITFEPVSSVQPAPPQPSPAPGQKLTETPSQYVEPKIPSEIRQEEIKKEPSTPAAPQPAPKTPEQAFAPKPFQVAPAQSPLHTYVPASKPSRPAQSGGLELKIGTRVILIAGIITVIFGVGFFLKYVYENFYFPPWARVTLVAAGGLVAVILGDFLRRRNFEIVAKGISALGFILLYFAVYSGTRTYHLFSIELAFIFSIVVTASAMAYAVILNEIFIAFLSLLGGYLVPAIISKGQFIPIPFSYVLALSAGAMGCAMFRRWRAVNWIAMTCTWLLYTAWFEKFYTSDQMAVALVWLSVFACLFLVLPILHGLIRRIEARREEVTLIVVNSIAAFYYLFQIFNGDDPKKLALATGLWGAAHLAMMAATLWRCRSDEKLHASLGVLGTCLITAALPMYFAFDAAMVGWIIEAVALTYIGIRYQARWTKVMGLLVAGVTVAGLFYHLPLHLDEDFKVFLSARFGTWLFVSAGLLVCHLFWRLMKQAGGQEASFAAQLFYAAGILLLTAGLALEWHAYCRWHVVFDPLGQAQFLKGMMMLAILLVPALLARPLRPRGELVQTAGIISAIFGAVFFAIAMMGVYHQAFRLFVNAPFALAMVFLAVLFWAAWQFKRSEKYEFQSQLPSAFLFLGLLFFFVVLTEQIYLYWSCQYEYASFEGDWKSAVLRYCLVAWAFYGLLLLAAGLRFEKTFIQAFAVFVTGVSTVGLFFLLPLHEDSEFKLVYNPPFITWAIVTVAILAGHGIWRFMRQAENKDLQWIVQFYYTAGLILLALGIGFEWAQHCRWHLEPADLAHSHLHLGLVLLTAFTVLGLLARPLAPAGNLVLTAGVLTALGGAVYTASAMTEVYYTAFTLFFNWPFAIAMFHAIGILLSAWFVRRFAQSPQSACPLAMAMVLSVLVLVWILLSEQVYSYWYCKSAYGPAEIANWSYRAQMYMSVSWAVYAAILMVIGFAARTAGIRWLSLAVFAVLLGKIFILDTATLRTEYRIAAFITTGLILVGVSFLYQLLKNKGFFDAFEKQLTLEKK